MIDLNVQTQARPRLHPTAARVFIEYVLSREGQLVIRSSNRNPTRSDLEQPVARATKLKLFEMNWDRVVKNYSRYEKDFNQIFGVSAEAR